MSTYTSTLMTAVTAFPLLAFLLTLPYMVYQYRKHGAVPWLHTLAFYSFVFYLLCAYFLVLLPLPADRTAVVPYAQTPQLQPFNFLREFMETGIFSPSDPSSWLASLRSPYIYEAVFNVALLTPLGMYLRYYFRRTWWQTLLIGFAVSLSFELTQLTGLWGYYEHPYRLFDVDDLITNTFGSMLGFWLVGPFMRVLPDVRIVNRAARERGERASVTRRAISFGIDFVLVQAVSFALNKAVGIASQAAGAGADGTMRMVDLGTQFIGFVLIFALVPALTHGQTPGQRLLRLRTVRPNAAPASWVRVALRYLLLYLVTWIPLIVLGFVTDGAVSDGLVTEGDVVLNAMSRNQLMVVGLWAAFMLVWLLTLVMRAVRTARRHEPFVMLNGVITGTAVMTEEGAARVRQRSRVLDVGSVVALEQAIAADGTSLAQLMDAAGRAVADELRTWVPDPAPIVVLSGSGNNGGDGWVCAHELALHGYPVTLVTPKLAEQIAAEPARQTAIDLFADAAARSLPMTVLVAPDLHVLEGALAKAAAVVDAVLGTGFSGDEVRDPYASWIMAANRRRFGSSRAADEHLLRAHGRDKGARGPAPQKKRNAPFAFAVDVPSGLSAQTGDAAWPCFYADVTVTMLAYKPGLVAAGSKRWTGAVHLAPLVDTAPYFEQDEAAPEGAQAS